ncbi:MAG: MFS transporter [Acidimicrobiia bacterium]|nr:MFS transporter [Acidimicrobiia bacterium]
MLKFHVRRPAIHHGHAEGAKLARLAFIVNVGDAAFWTVIPIHLAQLMNGEGPVGFYLAGVALIGGLATVFMTEVFEKRSKVAVGAAALIGMALLLIAMSIVNELWAFAAFDVPRSIGFILLTVVLGLLVRDHVEAADLAVEEGRFYLFSNLGWLIGPVGAGYVARFAGTDAVFVVIAAVFGIALLYLWRLHLDSHPALLGRPELGSHREAVRALIAFLRNPQLRRVFVLSLGLEVWWIISSIYIPLAVIDEGFGPDVVGWVVTGGVVPLVLMEVWVGKLAKRNGTGRYLTLGFLILAAGAVSFVVFGFNAYLLLFLFAAVNVGAAFVEPLTDTYFFAVATGSDGDRYFGIFNGAAPMAALIGPLFAAVFFSVGLGLNGVWIMAAAMMAAVAWVASRLPAAD